jgi:hypothetical protein
MIRHGATPTYAYQKKEINMGLKETMAEITAKGKDGLTYRDVTDTYIYHIRLDFDPVGIKFCANEDEVSKCKLNAKAKAKLTYCQQLAMARGGHLGMYMPSNMLLCENAEPVFGFRELDKEKDTKRHMKYLRNEELAWQAPLEKAKLPLGNISAFIPRPWPPLTTQGWSRTWFSLCCCPIRLITSSTTTWPPLIAAASCLIIRPIRRCAPRRSGLWSTIRPT